MEYIDLGLPSGNLWAVRNIGANVSNDCGNYYSYQEALEIQTEEEILPSKGDFQELISYCIWKPKDRTYKITGPNGNSIYLSITGYCYEGTYYEINKSGNYWSSTPKNNCGAYYLNFFNTYLKPCLHINYCYPPFKHTVRLIKKKNNMEKRKIEINLDTAKEWYHSDNESLKTIALQAFTEEELKNSLPKTWEEWATKNIRKDVYYIDDFSKIKYTTLTNSSSKCKNVLNTKEECEAHLALMQLHVLRDAYRDYYQKGWKPDWTNTALVKYAITSENNNLEVGYFYRVQMFLSFPTKELAEQFLENFRDLIEKAKELI